VACVNLIPQVTSLYWWEGEIQEDSEVLLIAKTGQERLEQLGEVLPQLHPYSVPELLVLPVEGGLPGYLKWVDESLTGLLPQQSG
jgi:periplasmic divalent cation tolerance protein